MDFSDADRADDDQLNDVLWRALKHTDPPATDAQRIREISRASIAERRQLRIFREPEQSLRVAIPLSGPSIARQSATRPA